MSGVAVWEVVGSGVEWVSFGPDSEVHKWRTMMSCSVVNIKGKVMKLLAMTSVLHRKDAAVLRVHARKCLM